MRKTIDRISLIVSRTLHAGTLVAAIIAGIFILNHMLFLFANTIAEQEVMIISYRLNTITALVFVSMALALCALPGFSLLELMDEWDPVLEYEPRDYDEFRGPR